MRVSPKNLEPDDRLALLLALRLPITRQAQLGAFFCSKHVFLRLNSHQKWFTLKLPDLTGTTLDEELNPGASLYRVWRFFSHSSLELLSQVHQLDQWPRKHAIFVDRL